MLCGECWLLYDDPVCRSCKTEQFARYGLDKSGQWVIIATIETGKPIKTESKNEQSD